jgi:type I restriction enzyme R subunit
MDTATGPTDYMLFIDGQACGILEAKREGANLGKQGGIYEGLLERNAQYVGDAGQCFTPRPTILAMTKDR